MVLLLLGHSQGHQKSEGGAGQHGHGSGGGGSGASELLGQQGRRPGLGIPQGPHLAASSTSALTPPITAIPARKASISIFDDPIIR